jgi:RNA polymerase sigma-70 factor, ECF subfamily
MEVDIEKLIKLIKKRKQEALKKVMDLYMNSVYGLARAILSDLCSKEDIEECVQDVFISAWNEIDKYDENRGSFKTWLLILCKYKALAIRKEHVRRSKIINLEEIQCAAKENPEEDLLAKESREEVLKEINAFNPVDREIFLRRYLLNQDIDEICTILELSRQAVDNRLWRGRKRLKEILYSSERGAVHE